MYKKHSKLQPQPINQIELNMKFSDQFKQNVNDLENIWIDYDSLDPQWKKFLENKNNQFLLFKVIDNGFERTFKNSMDKDKDFLRSIETISVSKKLLEKKLLSLQHELPDARSLPKL